ncbi:chaperone protein HchA [Legionella bozemanae]|uniref:Intracellular protease/amidase n=1 Tax=Legionella bozemanae TaxID=447 RepID=A0A0W0RJV0_LEGBO|nr:intracellular protease/amidase [Legionella bozemanae]STO33464.1 chaperone protein HchA [Legionella bozemanae]
MILDKISRKYWKDASFRELLKDTKALEDVSEQQFDCVYLAGGHGAMCDFPNDIRIQYIIKKQYESDKMVAAICHGVCGLLNVKLSNGEYLIQGKIITGFNWFEECLARRKKETPFNLENELKKRSEWVELLFWIYGFIRFNPNEKIAR